MRKSAQLTARLVIVAALLLPLRSASSGETSRRTLVLSVGSPETDARAQQALLVARVERTLERARRSYTQTDFDGCVRDLRQIEGAAVAGLRPVTIEADLVRLKTINLWLGLCLSAAGETNAATETFALAHRLPGDEPDPTLFPPSIMRAYQQAATEGPHCVADVRDSGDLWVDGGLTVSGANVELGKHYVVWQVDEQTISFVQIVGQGCALSRGPVPASSPPTITPDELREPEFLQRIGKAGGVSQLFIVGAQDGQPLLKSFSVESAAFLSASEGPYGGAPEAKVQATPWYKKWWIWTLIGVGVAGVATAIAVPLATRGGEQTQVSF